MLITSLRTETCGTLSSLNESNVITSTINYELCVKTVKPSFTGTYIKFKGVNVKDIEGFKGFKETADLMTDEFYKDYDFITRIVSMLEAKSHGVDEPHLPAHLEVYKKFQDSVKHISLEINHHLHQIPLRKPQDILQGETLSKQSNQPTGILNSPLMLTQTSQVMEYSNTNESAILELVAYHTTLGSNTRTKTPTIIHLKTDEIIIETDFINELNEPLTNEHLKKGITLEFKPVENDDVFFKWVSDEYLPNLTIIPVPLSNIQIQKLHPVTRSVETIVDGRKVNSYDYKFYYDNNGFYTYIPNEGNYKNRTFTLKVGEYEDSGNIEHNIYGVATVIENTQILIPFIFYNIPTGTHQVIQLKDPKAIPPTFDGGMFIDPNYNP